MLAQRAHEKGRPCTQPHRRNSLERTGAIGSRRNARRISPWHSRSLRDLNQSRQPRGRSCAGSPLESPCRSRHRESEVRVPRSDAGESAARSWPGEWHRIPDSHQLEVPCRRQKSKGRALHVARSRIESGLLSGLYSQNRSKPTDISMMPQAWIPFHRAHEA